MRTKICLHGLRIVLITMADIGLGCRERSCQVGEDERHGEVVELHCARSHSKAAHKNYVVANTLLRERSKVAQDPHLIGRMVQKPEAENALLHGPSCITLAAYMEIRSYYDNEGLATQSYPRHTISAS